ncbi:GTP-binding protein Era [Eubacterium ruminantium]|uniref:GTPase Era n=1 Tax=Eubacterium ruminantium TaxID=42322 RepID=A0A1T4PZX5_9FIRM|nr:GTPase Era [Eubacterium ruminantium]SCW65325.1 GTP-binding protein Era [Eubacterium ruminantium]SDN24538.1 GTP-binding protein Era [Eubacterium ruminantium]SJZ97019.1 GTP-binding protein Era [Eubacterium ruminantium]
MQEDKKFRSGFVAIIGRPNVGKSTLMNCIIGQKIAIMSSKAQTTRKRIETVYTNDEGQIVFLDTPGMNRSRNKLGDFMVNEVSSAFSDADVVMWIIEPGDRISAGEQEIAEKLAGVKKPVILVINKVDVNTDEEVFKTIDIYKDVLDFTDIVPVSALREKNREELINVIIKNLPEGPMYYDEDTVTEETERDICAELIREQALQKLDKEIPHGIAVEIDTMKVRPDGRITDVEATIICERDSHKGIIIGKGGAMLKRIGTGARIEMEKLLMTKVNLKLFVKVRRDWRDNQNMLRNFGYSDKR